MAFKFFAAFAVVTLAVVTALPYHIHEGHHGHEEHHGGGSSHQNVHIVAHHDGDHGHEDHHHDHHDDHAEYKFDYGVKDKKTGDVKSHSETRKGHKVEGKYELIDADGHKRTVHYTADKHSGFHAVVHREPTHEHHGHGGHEGHHETIIFHGGDAKVSEYGHGGHEEHGHHDFSEHGHHFEHGHSDHGHFDHGHSSEHGYTIKQEHATAIKVPHHHEHHEIEHHEHEHHGHSGHHGHF